MVKGGYQIINFNGVKFIKNTPMKLSNIYDKIEGTDKAILLSGLNVNGVDYRDIMCTPIVNETSYVIKAFDFSIDISDTDIVTVGDDIIDLGEINVATAGTHNVSQYVYNLLEDCINGKFSTLRAYYDTSRCYFNIVFSDPSNKSIQVNVNGNPRNISLQNKDQIIIS